MGTDYPENKLSGAVFAIYADSNGSKEFDPGDVKIGTLTEENSVYGMDDLRYRTITAFHTDTDSLVYSHTHIASQEDVIEFLADLRLEYPQFEEIEAQEGMEFVTLSTCEISKPNGRAVLVGASIFHTNVLPDSGEK